MGVQQELPLPTPASSDCIAINGRCRLRIEEEHRVVVVAGVPVYHYDARDAVAEAYARVFLVNAGLASQLEVAKAFGCSDRTIRRDSERYAREGMAGLLKRSG